MMLLSAGVDTSTIALWLGHEQERTTHIYLHADSRSSNARSTAPRHPTAVPGATATRPAARLPRRSLTRSCRPCRGEPRNLRGVSARGRHDRRVGITVPMPTSAWQPLPAHRGQALEAAAVRRRARRSSVRRDSRRRAPGAALRASCTARSPSTTQPASAGSRSTSSCLRPVPAWPAPGPPAPRHTPSACRVDLCPARPLRAHLPRAPRGRAGGLALQRRLRALDLRGRARRPNGRELWSAAKERPAGLTRTEAPSCSAATKSAARSNAPSACSRTQGGCAADPPGRARPIRRGLDPRARPRRLTHRCATRRTDMSRPPTRHRGVDRHPATVHDIPPDTSRNAADNRRHRRRRRSANGTHRPAASDFVRFFRTSSTRQASDRNPHLNDMFSTSNPNNRGT